MPTNTESNNQVQPSIPIPNPIPNPIQPFVPVESQERTELYTHKELRAFTSTDARNELDEMSEPHRFHKDLTKPDAEHPSSPRIGIRGKLIFGFFVGASVGALLMALTSPQSGSQIRGWLKGRLS